MDSDSRAELLIEYSQYHADISLSLVGYIHLIPFNSRCFLNLVSVLLMQSAKIAQTFRPGPMDLQLRPVIGPIWNFWV